MPNLTNEEVAALIEQLDEMCRQASELTTQLKTAMVERARRDLPAAVTLKRVPKKQKRATKPR